MSVKITLLAAAIVVATGSTGAAERTASIVVTASVQPRTSLTVSSNLLRFEVADPSAPVTATVDYSARVRTAAEAQVMLTVQAAGVATSSGALTLATDLGSVTLADAPVVAARWTGSGRRDGRLQFELRPSAPGVHDVPLRFVLSVP